MIQKQTLAKPILATRIGFIFWLDKPEVICYYVEFFKKLMFF